MTPRRARRVLLMFLVLAAGVAHNALFRQARPNADSIVSEPPPVTPAPKAPAKAAPVIVPTKAGAAAPAGGQVKEAADKRAVRTARVKPDWAAADVAAPPAAAKPQANVDTLRAVERELRRRGYGSVASDGAMRPMTRAAIMAYEFDHGLPLTGEASDQLLSALLFGGAPGADPRAVRKVATAEAQELVRSVQQSLSALGYHPGPVDGQLEDDTQRAIREFEMDKGLVPKGRVSAEVLARLRQPTAGKLATP